MLNLMILILAVMAPPTSVLLHYCYTKANLGGGRRGIQRNFIFSAGLSLL